uniref:Uncharacterized protein n=1 Tax=Solanum lycopersicum TaxID=4081 RepID=A0A3Q7EX55_SOLLC
MFTWLMHALSNSVNSKLDVRTVDPQILLYIRKWKTEKISRKSRYHRMRIDPTLLCPLITQSQVNSSKLDERREMQLKHAFILTKNTQIINVRAKEEHSMMETTHYFLVVAKRAANFTLNWLKYLDLSKCLKSLTHEKKITRHCLIISGCCCDESASAVHCATISCFFEHHEKHPDPSAVHCATISCFFEHHEKHPDPSAVHCATISCFFEHHEKHPDPKVKQ